MENGKGVLLIWAVIYALGMHPDATWGDGIGYALAVQKGYDLATNANSHFLYLVSARALLDLLPGADALDVLRGVSWLSSLFCLWLVYLSGKLLLNHRSGILSMTILAACFSFWRHACIIEVYTFALCFWGAWWYGLLLFLHNRSASALWIMALSFSLGLLAHIQLVLLLPAWGFFIARYRLPSIKPFFSILLPLAVFYVSVVLLKTNSWSSIFTDQIGEQLFVIDWKKIALGPFFTLGMLLVLFPALMLYVVAYLFLPKKPYYTLYASVLIFAALVVLPVLGFASLYPEPGIHVFYLPALLVLATLAGCLLSQRFSFVFVSVYPVVQVLFAFLFTILYAGLFKTDAFLQWKGGPGYLFLPWARGNATSVLDVARKYELSQLPEPLHWNVGQAKEWIELVEKPE